MITWTHEEMHALEDAINDRDYGWVRTLRVMFGEDKFKAMVATLPTQMVIDLGALRVFADYRDYERRVNIVRLVVWCGVITVMAFVAYRALL